MPNDISNLLSKFGANANGYLEVENTVDYKHVPKKPEPAPVVQIEPQAAQEQAIEAAAPEQESPLPEPPTAPADTPGSQPPVAAAHVDAPAGELPALSDSVAAKLSAMAPHAVSSTLRSLLSEVAQQRQAEARNRDGDASVDSVSYGLPPYTQARVIAIASPKGGVGKSTICAALAGALHPKGRLIAIDLDQQNALQYHMGVNLTGNSTNDAEAASGNWTALLRNGAGGVQVLPYTSIAATGRRSLETAFGEDKHWLARQLASMNLDANDVVLLDTPAVHSLYLEQVLDVADQVVLVVTADPASFMSLDHLDQLFAGHADVSYIVNQFDMSRTFSQDMLEVFRRRLDHKLIGVVPLDHAISEGLVYGLNPLLIDELSQARQEIQAIGDLLSTRIANKTVADGRTS